MILLVIVIYIFLFLLALSGYIYGYAKELENKSEELRKYPLVK